MKKILVSLLSVIMVACMALTLAACGENDPTPSVTPSAGTSATLTPTADPTTNPTTEPTAGPTSDPTTAPTGTPTTEPTGNPTVDPTTNPTGTPTVDPTAAPTTEPSVEPTVKPTTPQQNLYASIIAAIEAGKYDNLELNVPLGFVVSGGSSSVYLPTQDEYDFLDQKGDGYHRITIKNPEELELGTKTTVLLQNVNVVMIRSGATFSLKLKVSIDYVRNYRELGEGALTYTEGHWEFTSEDGTVTATVSYSDGREFLDIDKETNKVIYRNEGTQVLGSAEFTPGTMTVDTDKIEESTKTETEMQIMYFTESGIYVADQTLGDTDSEDDLLFHYGSWDYVLDQFVAMMQDNLELNVTKEELLTVFNTISTEWKSEEVQAALTETITAIFNSFELNEVDGRYELTFSADLAPIVNLAIGMLKLNGETPLYEIINNIYLAATEKEEGDVATDVKAMLPMICAFSVEDAFAKLEEVLAENGTSIDGVVEELLPYINQVLGMLPEGSLPEGIELPLAKDTVVAMITMVRAQYGEMTVADLVEMIAGGASDEPSTDDAEPSEEPAFDAVAYLSALIDQAKEMLSSMTIKGLIDENLGEGIYDLITTFYAQKIEGTLTFTFDSEYRLIAGTFAYEVNVGFMTPAETDEGEPTYSPILALVAGDLVDENGTLKGEYTIEIDYDNATITLPSKLIPNDPEETYDFVTAPAKDNLTVTVDGDVFIRVEATYASAHFYYTDSYGDTCGNSCSVNYSDSVTVTTNDDGDYVITVDYQKLATAVKAALASDINYAQDGVLDDVTINFYLYTSYEEDAENNKYAYYSITITQVLSLISTDTQA